MEYHEVVTYAKELLHSQMVGMWAVAPSLVPEPPDETFTNYIFLSLFLLEPTQNANIASLLCSGKTRLRISLRVSL